MHDGPNPIADDLAAIDARINALSKRIRGMPDRRINTAPHIALVRARRELMAERSALINRQCSVTQ
jgi:hypothetical protein